MEKRESETVEFKREVGDGAVKAVIAFVNSRGGEVLIGVNNDGEPCGLSSPDSELLKLTSMLRDKVSPDVLMFVSSSVRELEGESVIDCWVTPGTKKPYYLRSKGLRPEGVYVRHGSASVPASETAIRRMISESDGLNFESQRSIAQELTFEYASPVLEKHGMGLSKGEMRTLCLTDSAGLYTNLAFLISDQCPAFLKAAVFSDDARTVFLQREEFSGSILKQLDDAYAFMERNTRFVTDYVGLERRDHHDYPPIALREALVNAVVHRDYSLSGPTLISIMPSNVEVVSLGGLPVGIEKEDLDSHVSVPRNVRLANVFFRLELIEAYGTGISRMRSSYAESGMSVEFKITPNTFTVILPNRNSGATREDGTGKRTADLGSLTAVERKILSLADEGSISRASVQTALAISQSTATRALNSLVEKGYLVKTAPGRNTRYIKR